MERQPPALIMAALVAAWLAAASAASAQVAPEPGAATNPGLIQNENERNRRQVEQQGRRATQPAIDNVPESAAALGKPGGPTILLHSVTFDASVFLSKRELDAVVAPYLGRQLDGFQLARLLKQVNDLYARKGDVAARAFYPKQDLATGQLRIGFVEGRVGAVKIDGGKHYPAAAVATIIPIVPGTPADIPKLAGSIAAFNRTHNAQLRASLEPGASFGLTDIALAVLEPPTTSLQMFLDNQGVASVGKLEAGINLQFYGLLARDDRLTLYGVAAEGNKSLTGSFSLPLDAVGGRVGVSGSAGDIRVYHGAYRDLGIRGNSDNFGFNASEPLVLDQHWQWLASGGVNNSLSHSTQDHIDITRNTTNKLTAGTTLGYTGDIFSASVSPVLSFARTHYAVSEQRQNFHTLDGFANASLRLPAQFSATALAGWQVASDKLIPGDQLFQIGGPTTVRGYPNGAVAGASGYYTNLELHRGFPLSVQHIDLFTFYDHGEVFSTFPERVKMDAVGVGASASLYRVLVGELSAGFPVRRSVDNQSGYSIYFRITAHFE